MPTTRVRTILNRSTVVLLLCSVALNGLQAHRLRGFTDATVSGPQLGEMAPPLVAKTLDGHTTEIAFRGQPTILYYFSPTCAWCGRNWLNIKAIIAGTEGRYRFIGLSASAEVSAFLRAQRLTCEVYVEPSEASVRAYRFAGTPETVVVSADGKIQYAWAGAFKATLQGQVERALHVTLPGLQPGLPERVGP